MTEVRRDGWGVPHVVAGSAAEVAFAQGRSVAADRTWQLEHARAKAEGRLAALVGPAGLPWDRLARRYDLAGLARRALAGLDPESAAFVDAFVAGVDEGLAGAGPVAELQALDARPGRWSPWTPLAVFAAHHLLFATFPAKLFRRTARAVLDERVAALLHHEGVTSAGSNAWVVGGGRTASGLPMIGGDPHRAFESPNAYQQVRLVCTDPDDPFDVLGFTFPGVPGVQHFAHAGSVAWGITNAMADYQDLFVEHLDRRPDGVWVEGADGRTRVRASTERIEVRGAAAEDVEVLVTPSGPVVAEGADGEALCLRTPAWVLGDLGFACLLPLLRARTCADVVSALSGWVEPVNNLLVADTRGDVRQQVVGRVPSRAEENRWVPVPGPDPAHRWDGWVDLPGRSVGPDDHLVTANHRMGPDFDRIGVDFSPPGRADRIDALLRGRTGLDRDDFAAVHRDTLAGQPAALALAVRRLSGLSTAAAALRAELGRWDQRFEADSRPAADYAAVRDALVERLATAAPFDALPVRSPYGAVLDASADPRLQLCLSLGALLSDQGRALLPDLDRQVAAAVEEVAAARRGPGGRSPVAWGDRHRYLPLHGSGHALADQPPLAGDNDCVRCTGSVPGSDVATRGSVARYVWDLGGLPGSGWVVPLGADGDPAGPHHHDQLPLWVAGLLVPLA